MGLYDEVICAMPLPDQAPFPDGYVFQTKSFDPALDRYTITEKGHLVKQDLTWDDVPEDQRPWWGTPEWTTNPICRYTGSVKPRVIGHTRVPYHGDVVIYGCWTEMYSPETWREYRVRFTHGVVEEICCVTPRSSPST